MLHYESYSKTKKQVCLENESFAYYSGFGGIELKYIEYGIEDHIYCVSNAWYGGETEKGYHKLKVYYSDNGDYVKFNGYKIPLNECIRM